MNMLDEIRNRNTQPTVSPRQDILQQQPTQQDTATNTEKTEISEIKRLEELLANFPTIASRIPIRLETPIKQELDELCQKEKITIETLLEAFYTTCKDKDTVMKQVVNTAKKRLKSRKEAGNIRSSITKLNNLTKKRK